MRIRGSIVTALVLALLSGAWILSGQIGPAADDAPARQDRPNAAGKDPRPFQVRIRQSEAEDYSTILLVAGQTAASRRVEIRTMLGGQIQSVDASEGQTVKAKDLIATLDPEDREEKLAEAEARVNQRELQYAAARKLAGKGFQTETRRATTFADLQTARAALKRIQTDLANTHFVAPFEGVLNTIDVQHGAVLQKGDRVAVLIDLDPILVTAYVSERDHRHLQPGQAASARLLDGTILNGVIRYVSARAEPKTRTLKAELEIPNPEARLIDGVTAELILPLPPVPAHRISAALFSLDEMGRLGVKIVDERNIVVFVPVSIVGGTEREVFIAGLPETAALIIVGQDFVKAGERVEAVRAASLAGPSS